jgi:hypothetical protein
MQIIKHCSLLTLLVLLAIPAVVQPQSLPGNVSVGDETGPVFGIPDTSSGQDYIEGLAGDLPECVPFYTFAGEAALDQFGVFIGGGGDVNGDGYDDLIVGAMLNDAGGYEAGRTYVYSGATGDMIYVFTGAAAGDQFGWPVAIVGDVNDDGYDDLIIGASHNDAGGEDAGRAYVFSGATGDTLFIFTGEAADDWLGWSVASAGDVNGDGVTDLIVGAPQSNAGGTYSGRAYVFSGSTGDTIHVFTGEAGDVLGTSVASAGDVDSDGFADLIVGAYLYGGTNAGRAYVFSGQTGDTIHVFTGEAANDQLGWAVASAGDVNNDGYDDLIVAADRNNAGGIDAGRVYVFSGDTGDALCVFTGEAAGDRLGWSCGPAGDINGDNYDDLIVGAWGNATGGTYAGRAYVFSGKTCDTLYTFTGGPGSDWLGAAVASVGDINGDGFVDLAVGSPGYDAGGTNSGKVDVFLGGWVCGDANGDLAVTMDDVIFLQAYYFECGATPCPWRASDLNCDGSIDIADIIYLAAFVNGIGSAPCCL